MERVVPSLDLETPLKLENSLSISAEWQSGHATPFSDGVPKTSFSNSDSHFKHLYSKIGMITSAVRFFQMIIVADSARNIKLAVDRG
jgi:hypothetical protein